MPLSPQDFKPPDSYTFVGILLLVINGLLFVLSSMGHFILRSERVKLETLKKDHDTLAAAHTESVIAQSSFVTRDEMEQFMRKLESRLELQQQALHSSNVDRFKDVMTAINITRAEIREDMNRIHSRIDEIKRG